MNLRTDSGQKTFKAKKGRFVCFVSSVVSLSSPFCVFLPLCLMAAARGAKYLEETRLRQQEGQRVRTEARIVQLKVTEIETRIADLERWKDVFESKSTARTLPFGSTLLSTSFLLLLFLLLSYYVFTSSVRPPTLD